MNKLARFVAPCIAGGALVLLATQSAAAQCNTVGGKGTAGDLNGAKFQAYEILLQQTDWGMWASWMASGAKVGVAPGYTVRGLRFRCKPGGWGQECLSQATLCKKA
jgi:hypothetical protein